MSDGVPVSDGLTVGVNLLWCLPGAVGGSEEYLARQLAGLADVAPEIDATLFVVPGYVDENWRCDLPGHLILLVRSGIYIMENLALEELAAARVRSFTLVATPLKLRGATGSPIRPIALVDE